MFGHARILFLNSVTGAIEAHAGKSGPAGYGKMVADNLAANGNSIGHEAVMVFFVLSGFLVGGSVLKLLKKGAWSWSDYLLKRLTRLWMVLIPALVLGMILDSAGMRLFSSPHSIYAGPAGQTLVMSNLAGRYTPGILLGNLAFLQNICIPTAGTNVALWSLSNEFWYYMAFPFLMLGLIPKTPFGRRACFLLVFLGIMFGIGEHSSRLFLVWVLGAVLSGIPRKLSLKVAKWGAVILTCALLAAMVWVKAYIANLAAAEFAIAALFACLLYMLLHHRQKAERGIYHFISALTAKMSYTLYLVHVPILVFLCACVNSPWRHWPGNPTTIAVVLMVSAFTLALAFGFYLLFEANTDRMRNFLALKLGVR